MQKHRNPGQGISISKPKWIGQTQSNEKQNTAAESQQLFSRYKGIKKATRMGGSFISKLN
jgi:hypothetical protein